jgi:hypothetical protein
MYNSLPTYIKEESVNVRKFAKVLKKFLCEKARNFKNYYISKNLLTRMPTMKFLQKILKASSQFIISPLTYICNQALSALSTIIFPSHLKYSVVKPLFKRGNKNDMSNYRAEALLMSYSKISDKLVYDRK